MIGALQSMLAISLTVLRDCLSGLIDGAVKISKNTSGGIVSPPLRLSSPAHRLLVSLP
jgi:hypothetical protein